MRDRLWSREFTAIASSNLLLAWSFYALIPTLPIYLTGDLGISPGRTGLIMSAFAVSGILVRPFAGYLIDNYHRFRLFIVSLSVITVLYLGYPFMSGVVALFSLRLIHGAVWGTCTSSIGPLVADTVPATRLGEGMGIFALGMPVGMTIGPMFGLEILKGRGSQAMFLSIFGISLLSLLIGFFAKIPSAPITRKKFLLTNLLHRKALPLSFAMFLIMIAYGAIVVFVGVYGAQKGFSNVPAFFLCFAGAIFFSRTFLGRLFDRGYFFQMIIAGLALTAAGMIWLGYAGSPAQFLVSGVVNGFGFGILMPACHAAVHSLVDPRERGAANSTYMVSYDLGLGVGSLAVGFLSDKMALGEIYMYSSLLVMLSAGIFLFSALPHYHRHSMNNRPDN